MIRTLIFGLLLAALLLSPCGCNILEPFATTFAVTKEKASYNGMVAQTAGIMVWADAGVVNDHPLIQSDVANGLQDKLKQAIAGNADELKETKFVSANTILRFQDDHPEMSGRLAADMAAQISQSHHLTRLVYIELTDVSTHPIQSVDLLHGTVKGRLVVFEALPDGSWKKGYEDVVTASYPDKTPPEGLPGLDETAVFQKTIDMFTTNVSIKFISHEAPPDNDPNNPDFNE